MVLKVKRSPTNHVRKGHRSMITGLIRAGRVDDALTYAKAKNELEWYSLRLSHFYPDKQPPSEQPASKPPVSHAVGGEGVRDGGTVGDWDQSKPVSQKTQCDPFSEVGPLMSESITESLVVMNPEGVVNVEVEEEEPTQLFTWPVECVGKVVGYCGNKQLMQLEVEVSIHVEGFEGVKGRKVCSVWKGGYNLFVGEVLKVKLESRVGGEAWYEVIARGADVGPSLIVADPQLGILASNDGLTAAPVGFKGQVAPRAVVTPESEQIAPIASPEPTLDNVQDLAERERLKAIAEMEKEYGSGSGL